MCGIFAWWPTEDVSDAALSHRRGLDTLAPRGPDSEGVWRASDGSALLGHRRLAITGKKGAQPLWSPDGSIACLVNGEFYDTQPHRQAFARQGWRFDTDTDSEVLLPMYATWGAAAFDRLEGEFAFVVWDRGRGRIWMARDRAGVRPLRVAEGRRGLAVASEAKALLAAGWPARWNEESLADALALQYPDPSQTLFDGVGQLEPGESRCYDKVASGTWARTSSLRAWSWFSAPVLSCPAPEEAAFQLEDALTRSVRRRLDTSWPVAVHLSGGLDSSAILALAARERPSELAAFSVAFDEVDGAVAHDESGQAQATSKLCKVPWHRVPVSASVILDEWPSAVAVAEGLGINGHLVAKRRLAHAIHEAGYRVTLTGEGADEALLGYAFLAADADASGIPLDMGSLWAANPVAHGVMLPDGPSLDMAAIAEAWGWVPTWLQAKAVLGARVSTLLTPEWRHERVPSAVRRWALREPHRPDLPRVHQAAAAWARRALGGYMLPALADAPESGMGIENRVPFLDRSVLEVTAGWHPSVTGWPTVAKAPLRLVLEGLGLAGVARRPKHPFEAPPLWATPAVRQALRARWSDAAFWTGTPFSAQAIAQMMDRLDAGDAGVRQQWEPVVATLLSVVSLESAYSLGWP